MGFTEEELKLMDMLRESARKEMEKSKQNNEIEGTAMKIQEEVQEKSISSRQRVMQGFVKVVGPALKPSLKMLAFLMFLAFLVVGSIVIVEFSRFFSEYALKMSALSIESTQGSLLTIACYVTGFIAFIKNIPAAYKHFMDFANAIKVEV